MNIAYVAQTGSSTLLLDPNGVCLESRPHPGQRAEHDDGATRCVGAQYVASLDLHAEGGLVEHPRVGCPMLFAATERDGRIYLVRTGPVVHFDEMSSSPASRAGAVPRSRYPRDEELTTALPFRAIRAVIPDPMSRSHELRASAYTLPPAFERVGARPTGARPMPMPLPLPPPTPAPMTERYPVENYHESLSSFREESYHEDSYRERPMSLSDDDLELVPPSAATLVRTEPILPRPRQRRPLPAPSAPPLTYPPRAARRR